MVKEHTVHFAFRWMGHGRIVEVAFELGLNTWIRIEYSCLMSARMGSSAILEVSVLFSLLETLISTSQARYGDIYISRGVYMHTYTYIKLRNKIIWVGLLTVALSSLIERNMNIYFCVICM